MTLIGLVVIYWMQLTIINAGFIPGKNCGTLTKITKIMKLPTEQEEIEALSCVIVQDDRSFQAYMRKRPCKCFTH